MDQASPGIVTSSVTVLHGYKASEIERLRKVHARNYSLAVKERIREAKQRGWERYVARLTLEEELMIP